MALNLKKINPCIIKIASIYYYYYYVNKIPEGQPKMDNLEKLAT